MNDNNNQNQTPDGEKKPGGTLDLQNISIKTLKDDLAEGSGEDKKDQSGWFGFMAKHKESNQSPVISDQESTSSGDSLQKNQNEPEKVSSKSPETSDSALDKELDQFKKESEKDSVRPDASLTGIEAPANLPISDKTLSPLPEEEETDLGLKAGGEEAKVPDQNAEIGSLEPGAMSQEQPSEEKPALGSFFPPKIEIPDEEDDEEVNKIKPMPKEGIAGSIVESEIETAGADSKNPFATRLQKNESEKKSLLQSVESALNYSAPPEFSEARANVDEKGSEEGKVVDLREKAGVGGILKNKKLLIIFGGAGGLVVIMVVLALVLRGSSGTGTNSNSQANANVNSQANINQNISPVSPIKPVTPPQPAIPPQKVLANAINLNISSIDAITDEIDKLRDGQGVQKQTQLIFLKSDGSSATFQDLMNATGINIPQRVLSQPNAVPALVFADFFKGQTILGLIIPTTDSEAVAASKMKNWESTIVLDLDELWEGIEIDNQGAYFADSQLFKNARFALIDKTDKLSLDYSIEDGFIFITCGKDSMIILKNNFNGSSTSSSSSNNGIKWEEDETVTTSGVQTGSSATSPSTSSTSNASSVSGGDELDIQVEATDD